MSTNVKKFKLEESNQSLSSAFVEEMKNKLLKMKVEILNLHHQNSSRDLKIDVEDLSDEGDLAQSVINQNVALEIHKNSVMMLRNIDVALDKIHHGHYGRCDDCEELIEHNRLVSRPWADLCLEHAEEKEKNFVKRKSG